ncbi:MAG TPA: nucleotidyl transferase AbiEii/AbiGii toxin family protein, partial [Archaeoglobaceae archaeon]|nr:nucleotidyl transferase AbiEii/AbiGii toxin family protein [Archaeoglobaceae archaeon]
MLSFDLIKKLAKKHQTKLDNIVREYIQHLFLFFLYQQKEADCLYFKGGTALKIIYQSPRFSEDLDFNFKNFLNKRKIEALFINTLNNISEENIEVDLKEAKFTSGGYLGIIGYKLFDFKNEISFEVSFRKKEKLKKEVTTIVSDYISPYLVIQLSPAQIVEEKILAALERGKPRDYYDLYFILRNQNLRRYIRKVNLKKIKDRLDEEKI